MTARLNDNTLKGIILIILSIILVFQSIVADAQSYPRNQMYMGFSAGFGTRSSEISSNIAEIHAASLLQAGGQVGVIVGNSIVRSRIGLLGYYSSTGNTAGTTDLYESNAVVNFYPLALISGKGSVVEPYINGGLSYDRFKFFGYYVNQEPGQINYSQAEAPYLGKVKQVNATVGVGVEVKLKDAYDFIHLFSEVRYGRNLSSKSDADLFSGTHILNQTQVVVGISFGAIR